MTAQKILLILALAIASGIGLYGYANKERGTPPAAPAVTEEAPISIPLSSPPSFPIASPTPIRTDNGTYTHPQLKYTVTIPKGWTAERPDFPTPDTLYAYTSLDLNSPDYHRSDEDPAFEGIDYIAQGAQIYISARHSRFPTIEETFQDDEYMRDRPNRKDLIVAGDEAIQVDYGFENIEAVVTLFLHEGVQYTILYSYTLGDDRNQYIDVYRDVLDSLRFSEQNSL